MENMLREFEHVLTLRVRMPIDGDVLCNKRNFIYKIAHYNKVACESANFRNSKFSHVTHHGPLLHNMFFLSVAGGQGMVGMAC